MQRAGCRSCSAFMYVDTLKNGTVKEFNTLALTLAVIIRNTECSIARGDDMLKASEIFDTFWNSIYTFSGG